MTKTFFFLCFFASSGGTFGKERFFFLLLSQAAVSRRSRPFPLGSVYVPSLSHAQGNERPP